MKLRTSLTLFSLAVSSLQADLIAHWPLDTDASDSTGNAHDGAVDGGTVNFGQAGANANTGTAASFPDFGHIDVPFDAALNPSSFTITLWVNSGPTGAHASPITSRDDVGNGVSTHGYIIYHNPNGNWDFWSGDGDSGWDDLVGDPVAVNTWTHLAITYDANTDTKTLYVDGVLSATDNLPQSGPTQYSPNGTVEMEALHIGSGEDGGGNFHFDGLIDDVGIWDEVLDVAIIQSVMTNGISSELPDPTLSAPNPLDLTLDGSIQSFDIPITNKGQTQNLTVSAASFNGDANFSVTTLPGPITPAGMDNIVISFDPLGANGAFSADLEITSNDSLNPVRTITLQGSIHDPMLVVDNLVDLGENTTGAFTLTNDGATRPLQINSIDIEGDDDHFSIDSVPNNIPANGGTDDIDITFDPLGEEGSFSVTLTINTDDPINPAVVVTVTASVPFTDNLVAWWSLDVDGTDDSGNGFDGTLVGTPTASTGANGATGGSLDFDGFSSRIDVPYDPALNSGDFTVTLWANADEVGGGTFRSPITNRDDVAPGGAFRHGWIIYNNSNGFWSFWNGGGTAGDGGWNVADGPAVTPSTWTHIAISYDSGTNTKTMYINGTAESTTNPVAFSPNNGDLLDGFTHESEMLHIGAGQDDGMNFWFDGRIDDVGLFRVALPAVDIASIMTNGMAGYTGVSQSPEISNIVLNPENGHVTITFNSLPGAEYIVERSTNLENWLELTDDHESEGDVTNFLDTTVPDGTTKIFYRVQRL